MNNQLQQQIRKRVRLLSIVVLAVSLLLFTKLYMVQIVNYDEFSERADRQYQKPADAFNRGTIYFSDRTGNLISAATLKTGFLIAINPKILQKNNSVESAYQKISAIIPLDEAVFLSQANKANDTYEEVKKRASEDEGKAIAALKIPGVSVFKDKWRYYPGGTLAAHVLGFMGYKGDEISGRYGLERQYNDTLSRESDAVYVNFFAEMFSNLKKTVGDRDFEGDIVTTIEPRTQAYVENMLKGIQSQYSAERTGAIIMNPSTGEIHAMAINPTFDPNNFKEEKNVGVFKNDLVESVYEMGSIIKPLTMAVGVDQGKVHATSTYNDTGSISSDGRTIWNFDKKGRGVITLQYALSKSLNTGFAYIVQRVGNKTFAEYVHKFGLGERTGIDLPNESKGLLDNLKSPRNIEYITASFGQGIAVSPIEVTRAFASVVNGGKLVQPRVVKKIQYKVGFTKEVNQSEPLRVISESTAEEIRNMMVYNVDNSLLDGKAKNPRYAIGAKTGTAQIAERGSYSEDRFLHSFVGFLPEGDPQFVVFMYIVNPRGVNFASETLAKPFIELTKFLINYYQIPPDR
ncbi:MAG: penicillin-binding protein 2 [Candidatus Taylorbacteria bacterium]|nr:penicillin-binding protein 2 [Candidatus Taylorbacteria bacterium]